MNGEEALNKLMKSVGCNSICNNMNYDRESYKVVLRNLKVLEGLRKYFVETIIIKKSENGNKNWFYAEDIVKNKNIRERDISLDISGGVSLPDILIKNNEGDIAKMLCEWLDEPSIEDEALGKCIRHVINFKWTE